MKYICYEYYVSNFGGSLVPEDEFGYLANAAEDVIDMLVTTTITAVTNNVRRAAAYELETLYSQGGTDALTGLASITSGIDEKLGDYSLGTPYVSNEKRIYSIGGVPVAGLTLALLKKDGLMGRCIYAESVS